jgi:hypothetical protein
MNGITSCFLVRVTGKCLYETRMTDCLTRYGKYHGTGIALHC